MPRHFQISDVPMLLATLALRDYDCVHHVSCEMSDESEVGGRVVDENIASRVLVDFCSSNTS